MSRHLKTITRSFAGGEMSPEMFGRMDDVKFQAGAATLLNVIPRPEGTVFRRPGTRLVHKSKDSAKTSHLFPFVFSPTQSLVIEGSRATVDSREIGHFRFHTNGGTLLYSEPTSKVVTYSIGGASVASQNRYENPGAWPGATRSDPAAKTFAEEIEVTAGLFTTTTNHELGTGDPVVFTMNPSVGPSVVFSNNATSEDQEVRIPNASGKLASQNQQLIFAQTVSTPSNVEAGRIYYTTGNPKSNYWTFSETWRGPNVKGVGASGGGNVAAMPKSANPASFVVNRVYYAVAGTSSTTFNLAKTHAEALSGTTIKFSETGIGSTTSGGWNVHRAYVPGDLVDVISTGGSTFRSVYRCIKRPWCSADEPNDFNYVHASDHLGHPLTKTSHWFRMPGFFGPATFTSTEVEIAFSASREVTAEVVAIAPGDTVVFFPTSPTAGTAATSPMVFGKVYYAREVDATISTSTITRFKVSETATGPVVALVGSVTGVSVLVNSVYEVPHDYTETELSRVTTTQSNDVLTLASAGRPAAELKRLSASRWELDDIKYTAAAKPPARSWEEEIKFGETVFIYKIENAAASHGSHTAKLWLTTNLIPFSEGDPIYVEGVGYGVADGFYIVHDVEVVTARMWIRNVESSTPVTTTAPGVIQFTELEPPQPLGRARYSSSEADLTNSYKITSIDDNGEESEPSEALTVSNNLMVPGASNTIGWYAVAARFRVYKELNSLYGFIGEVDASTFTPALGWSSGPYEFKDDNIAPDLAISPPITDPTLRRTAYVTFDIASDLVNWSEHKLSNGSPVVFFSNNAMPGITEAKTYYVINKSDDSFQITEDSETEAVVNITGSSGEHYAIAGNFPAAVSYFEGRRVFAGSRSLPQDVWATASGTERDLSYSIPTVDTDRIYFRIASREASQVRHIVPLSHLMLLSNTTEFRLTPVNDDTITPSSVSVRPQSFIGCDYPQPSLVNNTVIFAADRGGHVRELGFSADILGYMTGDLSLRAAHLFDNLSITQQAYAKAPLPVVWFVSSSGKLLGLTYVPEEQVGAWHQHTTDGEFESAASVPEGDEDAVYVVVKRTIGSVTSRFVERFADQYSGGTSSLPDAYFLDSGLSYSGAATTTVAGLDHLNGSVSYLADGIPGTGTVTGGVLTLSKAASEVHVGLPYTSEIQTLPLTMMRVDAFGTGKTKSVNKVWVRVFESSAFKTGPTSTNLRASLTPSAGSLLTDLVQVTLPASWNDDGQIVIRQEDPLPLTVVGLTIEVAAGG